jgi:hypothetical protein
VSGPVRRVRIPAEPAINQSPLEGPMRFPRWPSPDAVRTDLMTRTRRTSLHMGFTGSMVRCGDG